MTVDAASEPRDRVPTVCFVPDGPAGDAALAAMDADYETAPPSLRVWLPGVGWVAQQDLGRIMDDAQRLERGDSGT